MASMSCLQCVLNLVLAPGSSVMTQVPGGHAAGQCIRYDEVKVMNVYLGKKSGS